MNEKIKEKIIKIIELAYQINPAPTNKESTGNKPTIFVDFSGHVTMLSVRIHSLGWCTDSICDKDFQILLGYENDCEELDECIVYLQKILEGLKDE